MAASGQRNEPYGKERSMSAAKIALISMCTVALIICADHGRIEALEANASPAPAQSTTLMPTKNGGSVRVVETPQTLHIELDRCLIKAISLGHVKFMAQQECLKTGISWCNSVGIKTGEKFNSDEFAHLFVDNELCAKNLNAAYEWNVDRVINGHR